MELTSLALDNIDLGRDEAEQETALAEYFLETGHYRRVSIQSKWIVIGRKGTGKSAIFKRVGAEYRDQGHITVMLDRDFVNWVHANAESMREQSAKWKMVFYCHAIVALDDLELLKTAATKSVASRARALLGRRQPRVLGMSTAGGVGHYLAVVKGFFGRLKSFTSPWGGLTLGDSDEDRMGRALNELEEVVAKHWPVDTKGVRICIDRLDDYWDASAKSRQTLSGLLQGAHQLNGLHGGRLKVVVFLRSDIYDNLVFNNKDHLRQDEERLTWDAEELKALLAQRVHWSLGLAGVSEDEIWDVLFAQEGFDRGVAPWKYVISRTFKRPRDIISLVRSALERAVEQGHDRITAEDVRWAEEHSYSRAKCEDLVIEYQARYPWIKNLIDDLSHQSHILTRDQLAEKLSLFVAKNSADLTVSQMVELLYQMGALGVRIAKNQASIFYYDDDAIRPAEYSWYAIHPALWAHMSITERRDRAPQRVVAEFAHDAIPVELEPGGA